MRGRSWAVAALVWVAVVVVAATATWAVIGTVGRVVLTAPDGDGSPGGRATSSRSTPAGSTAPGDASRRASGPPERPAHNRRDVPATPRATAQPEASSAPTSAPRPRTTSPASSPSSSPASGAVPSPAPRPAPEVRTWQGAAGAVSARCLGARISLVSASPADGWRMEVDKRGPEEVRVHFERGETDDESESEPHEREAQVDAWCRGGVPRFAVES